jgi:hypothetical protein
MRLSPIADAASPPHAKTAELGGKGAKRPGLARSSFDVLYRFDEDERFAQPLSGSLRVADF